MEVTLSIGIMAFAFIAIFGLIPVGLNTFHKSMDMSIASQIALRLVSDSQQTNFDTLISGITGANATGRLPERQYNEQGTWGGDPTLKGHDLVYDVNQRIMPATAVPKTGTATTDNPNLVTLTVQVAYNPGRQALALETAGASDQTKPLRNLWTGAYQSNPNNRSAVPIYTYTAQIARNK